MPPDTSELGRIAEDAVAELLKRGGFRILDRNWRRPWGELDVVAEKDGIIHFVEVKASRLAATGFEPYRRAGAVKMHKVRRTAMTWLADHRYGSATGWQTDIASVVTGPQGPEIELFLNE